MPKKPSRREVFSIRLEEDIRERADALLPVVGAIPEVRAGGVATRATILRLALLRGLAALEKDHKLPVDLPLAKPPAVADARGGKPVRKGRRLDDT